MKRRILSIVLTAAMLLTLFCSTAFAFSDVRNAESYYYNPVCWAVERGITTGNTLSTFNPNGSCTRGQVVTFLWRAAGSPEPESTECDFTDVVSGKYYYKAVLWAVEKGITTGYSDNTFRPNKTVTRGQFVTFLWRYAGKPSPKSSVSTFSDVTGGSFYDAILWAAEQNVTSGYSDGTFRPSSPCKRGQVVTFLYRLMGEGKTYPKVGSQTADGGTIIDLYTGSDISITVSQYREHDTDIYLADVQLSDAKYLKTALSNDTFTKEVSNRKTTSAIAADVKALLAINGDFCGAANNNEYGYVVRNGIVYRDTSEGNVDLTINSDGDFSIITETEDGMQGLLDGGIQDIIAFGPALVRNGEIAVTVDQEVAVAGTSNPRTAIAQVGPLHYLFVVSDGRTDRSAGLSLYQLAQFLQDHGAVTGYNCDGGGSSAMVFEGMVINIPTNGKTIGERSVSDIIYIGSK